MRVSLNLVFAIAALVGMVTLAGVIILDVTGVSDSAFLGYAGSMVTTLIGFGGTLFGLQHNNQQTDTITTKVDGNLTKLIDIATQKAITPADHAQVSAVAANVGIAPSPLSADVPGDVTFNG